MDFDVRALLATGQVTRSELELVLRIHAREGGSILGPLGRIVELTDDDLCVLLSQVSGLPRASGEALASIAPETAALLPGELCRHVVAVPLRLADDGALVVAMADPTDEAAQAEIEYHTGRPLRLELATAAAVEWAIERHYPATEPSEPSFLVGDDDDLAELFAAACADESEILELVELVDLGSSEDAPAPPARRRATAH